MMVYASNLDCPSNQRCVAAAICSLDLDRQGQVPDESLSLDPLSNPSCLAATYWSVSQRSISDPSDLSSANTKRDPIMNCFGAKSDRSQSGLDLRETLRKGLFSGALMQSCQVVAVVPLSAKHPTSKWLTPSLNRTNRKMDNQAEINIGAVSIIHARDAFECFLVALITCLDL